MFTWVDLSIAVVASALIGWICGIITAILWAMKHKDHDEQYDGPD